MSDEKVIEVDDAGTMRFVWSDELRAFRDDGKLEIRRASHVEPNCDGMWEADLSPVRGPVLGPFDSRNEAIQAELNWLRENLGL